MATKCLAIASQGHFKKMKRVTFKFSIKERRRKNDKKIIRLQEYLLNYQLMVRLCIGINFNARNNCKLAQNSPHPQPSPSKMLVSAASTSRFTKHVTCAPKRSKVSKKPNHPLKCSTRLNRAHNINYSKQRPQHQKSDAVFESRTQ